MDNTFAINDNNTYLHGVSFTRSSLSIRKYTHIVTIDTGRHNPLDFTEYLKFYKRRDFEDSSKTSPHL